MSEEDQGADRDLGRMKQLDAELRRLIAALDARLPPPATAGAPEPVAHRERMRRQRGQGRDFTHGLAVAGIGALLVTAGWAGASMFYSSRLAARIEDKLKPYASELAETVTTIRTDLAPDIAAAGTLRAEIERARRDLAARDQEIASTVTAAQGQLLRIRDAAIDDVERRLTDRTDDLSGMLDMLRQRAVELDQGLDEVAHALAAFDHQLPVMTEGFGEVAAKLTESRTRLDRSVDEVSALDGKAPALLAAIQEHAKAVDGGGKTLAVVEAQLAALKAQAARSGRQLDQALEQGRNQAAGWEGAGRAIDARKQQIMRDLDHYAETLNHRVREFLEVLNSEAAFTGG